MATGRYIGWGDETTLGTAVAATVYKDLITETLVPNKNLTFLGDSRNRSAYRKISNAPIIQGDINCALVPEPDADIFFYLLGTNTKTNPESGVYQHDLTPADALTKSFTTRLGVEAFERVIAGCVVNQIRVDMIAKDPMLVWTASLLACSEAKATLGTATYSSLPEFKWHQGTITYNGGASTKVHAMQLRMNNNLNPDRMYAIKATDGDKFSRIDVGEMVVEGILDLYFSDSTEYDLFLAETEFAINAKFEGALCGATKKYTFEVDLPLCVHPTDTTPHINRQTPFRINAPFKAMYKTASGYIVKVRFINMESTCP